MRSNVLASAALQTPGLLRRSSWQVRARRRALKAELRGGFVGAVAVRAVGAKVVPLGLFVAWSRTAGFDHAELVRFAIAWPRDMVYRRAPTLTGPVGWCPERELPVHCLKLLTRQDLGSTPFVPLPIEHASYRADVFVALFGLFWMTPFVVSIYDLIGPSSVLKGWGLLFLFNVFVMLGFGVLCMSIAVRSARQKYLSARGRFRHGFYLMGDGLLVRDYVVPLVNHKPCLWLPRRLIKKVSMGEVSRSDTTETRVFIMYALPEQEAVWVQLPRFADDQEVLERIESWADLPQRKEDLDASE